MIEDARDEKLRAFRQDRLRAHLSVSERAWKAGSLPALADAIRTCADSREPLPPWVTQGVLAILKAYLTGTKARPGVRRGRLANYPAIFRQEQIDIMRWDAVTELRERKSELAKIGYGPTWTEAYINASNALAKTPAFGSPEAMRKSYQRIQQIYRKNPDHRVFYASFWDRLT